MKNTLTPDFPSFHLPFRVPLISNFPTRKDWEIGMWKKFVKRFPMLDVLISPAEGKKIIYRLACIDRLLSGIGPREIGRELWLTRQTISAIKKSFIDKRYQSSRNRGHIKRIYSHDTRTNPKKVYYRQTKYGKMRDWSVSP